MHWIILVAIYFIVHVDLVMRRLGAARSVSSDISGADPRKEREGEGNVRNNETDKLVSPTYKCDQDQ